MEHDDKNQLTQEYIKKMKNILPIIKIGGLNKFDIKNGQFVSITRFSQIYAFIVVFTVNVTGYSVLYETSIKNDFLTLPEFLTVIQLWIINNLILLNSHIFNKHSGADIMNTFIEMDLLLGVKQTKFMRDIATKDVLFWSGCVFLFQLVTATVLFITFAHLPYYIFFTGSIFFQLLFTLAYEQVMHVVLYKSLCLRVHYLNVGLVKIAKLNTKYLMDQLLLYPLFWKKEYDSYVDVPKADSKYFTETLGMVVTQLRGAQDTYRFAFLVGIGSLVLGTFLGVQTFIIFIKSPDMQLIQTSALTGWFIASWSIFIIIAVQTDKIHAQVQHTELICTYIQLKPNNSDDMFRLSRSILHTLRVSDYRISIYDLFYFNQGLLRSIATSVFVYITMQLQIAFPKV